MTALEVALAEAPVALELAPLVALVVCVVEWPAEPVAEPEAEAEPEPEAEAEVSEAEAEPELDADDSAADVGAAEVVAGAEEAAEEPEATLAQKVWTAGRTWSRESSC